MSLIERAEEKYKEARRIMCPHLFESPEVFHAKKVDWEQCVKCKLVRIKIIKTK